MNLVANNVYDLALALGLKCNAVPLPRLLFEASLQLARRDAGATEPFDGCSATLSLDMLELTMWTWLEDKSSHERYERRCYLAPAEEPTLYLLEEELMARRTVQLARSARQNAFIGSIQGLLAKTSSLEEPAACPA